MGICTSKVNRTEHHNMNTNTTTNSDNFNSDIGKGLNIPKTTTDEYNGHKSPTCNVLNTAKMDGFIIIVTDDYPDNQPNLDYESTNDSNDIMDNSSDSSDWDSDDNDENDNKDYPQLHNNLQSLLFSSITPYTTNDYRNIGNNQQENEPDMVNDVTMDWNDEKCVNKIKELISKLLQTSSARNGIKEDDIFLMFATPTPESIIQHLRFGALSDLCTVHIDRFGRRSYFSQNVEQKNIGSHFFTEYHLPSQLGLLLNGESIMHGLCEFVNRDSTIRSL